MRPKVDGECVGLPWNLHLGHSAVYVVEQTAEVLKPKGNATHDALCCVTGEEKRVGIAATVEKKSKLGLCEVLDLINEEVVDRPADIFQVAETAVDILN